MEDRHQYTKWVLLLLGVWLLVLGGFGVWYFWMSQGGTSYTKEIIKKPSVVVDKKTAPAVKATPTEVERQVVIGLQRVTRDLKVGQRAKVKVVALSTPGALMAGDFVFDYDPKVLKFVRIGDKAFKDVLLVRDDKKGEVLVSLKDDNGVAVKPQDSLVTVEFKVLKKGPAEVSLRFDGVGKTRDTNIIIESMPGEDALANVDPAVVSW
ncbi:MAG: hypothetical protein GXP43_00735 [bacterium]|nr:hypothetical protein [bacterium]